jgi:Ceramidase
MLTAPCPWQDFAPAVQSFCEEPRCAWVVHPAETWSNVGFFLVGWLILRRARGRPFRPSLLLGLIMILTGVGSTLFHATGTFFGEALDLGSMYLQSSLFIALNARRLWRWQPRPTAALFAAILVPSLALLLAIRTLGVPLFIAQVVLFVALELRLLLRYGSGRYGPLWAAVGAFALSYASWWLDKLGIVCNPRNHILTGHSVWHFLGALGGWYWYRFYSQFD